MEQDRRIIQIAVTEFVGSELINRIEKLDVGAIIDPECCCDVYDKNDENLAIKARAKVIMEDLFKRKQHLTTSIDSTEFQFSAPSIIVYITKL